MDRPTLTVSDTLNYCVDLVNVYLPSAQAQQVFGNSLKHVFRSIYNQHDIEYLHPTAAGYKLFTTHWSFQEQCKNKCTCDLIPSLSCGSLMGIQVYAFMTLCDSLKGGLQNGRSRGRIFSFFL